LPEYDYSYFARGRKQGIIAKCAANITIAFEARRLTSSKCPGKLLEIGFGDGSFLEAMAKRGWTAYGIDISDEAVALASKRPNLCVQKGDLLECGFQDSFFDLVVMRHVLEHLENPSDTLVEVRRIHRPGGVVFIAVPNIDSIESRIARDKWFHLDPRYHLMHYSAKTISKLLTEVGFENVNVSHMTLEYRQTLTYSVLSRVGLDSLINKNGDRSLAQRALLYMMFPFGIILSFACSLIRMGGTIQVTARRLL
jgi:2-polyprenyl-3-methyl-5-hydroxy-6-metoxy-1,4-benzoquinol methylase